MTSNSIETIPAPQQQDKRLTELKHLSLSSNLLHSWKDIDALPLWCPALESLMIAGNPLVERKLVTFNQVPYHFCALYRRRSRNILPSIHHCQNPDPLGSGRDASE